MYRETVASEMIANLRIDLIKDIVVRFAMESDEDAKAKFFEALQQMEKMLVVDPNHRGWDIINVVGNIS